MDTSRFWLWMLLILAAGLALRLVQAWSLGLWHDELFTTMVAAQPYNEFIIELERDVHPPLHPFLFRYLLWPLSQTDWVLRSLHALTYLGVAAAVVAAARKVPAASGFLLYFFLFISLNATHVYLSTEVRMYGLLSMLMAAALLLLGGLSGRVGRRSAIGAGFLLLLLNFTHYYGLFITCSLLVGWLALRGLDRRSLGTVVLMGAPTAVGYLLYMPWFLDHLGNASRVYYRGPGHLVGYLAELVNNLPTTLFFLGLIGVVSVPAAIGVLRRANAPNAREPRRLGPFRIAVSEAFLLVGIALLAAYPRFNPAGFTLILLAGALLLAGRWVGAAAVLHGPAGETGDRDALPERTVAMACVGLVVLGGFSIVTLVGRGSSIHNFGTNSAFVLYISVLMAYAGARSPVWLRSLMVAVFVLGSIPTLHAYISDARTVEPWRLSYREVMRGWEEELRADGLGFADLGGRDLVVSTAERDLDVYVRPVLERHNIPLVALEQNDPDFVQHAFDAAAPSGPARLWIVSRHRSVIKGAFLEAEAGGLETEWYGPGAGLVILSGRE